MAEDRERTREPASEPEQPVIYDNVLRESAHERSLSERDYVIKGDDISWEISRHAKVKWYNTHYMEDPLVQDITMFRQEIPERNGRHTHQGGVAIFGIKGEGKTVADGEHLPWDEGDLVALPITPGGGIEHQHFNRNDPDNPAQWLAIQWYPFRRAVGTGRIQNETAPWWDDDDHDHIPNSAPPKRAFKLPELDYDFWADYEPPETAPTLYDDLFVRRNLSRKQLSTSYQSEGWVRIAGDDLQWEWNPQGKMKWYLHPAFDDKCMQTLLYAVQEIPPGSHSGKQLRQGTVVHYLLEGEGYSDVNGRRYEWSEGDALLIPSRLEGHTVQHFNANSDRRLRMIIAEPFVHEAVGYDRGSGLEQLATCPEYEGELPEDIYCGPETLAD